MLNLNSEVVTLNNENLKKGNPDTQFRSGREAVENGRKGGKASGISRSFKSALKKKFKENPELYEELIDMLTDEALTGRNLKAADMLLDLMGESVQREALALKRKELKSKENAAKSSNPKNAEYPMLYKALEDDTE